MTDNNGSITGHFIAHWGVPSDIRIGPARGIPELAILEFAPRGPRTTWRYATNGMSSYLQTYPDVNVMVRTEVYVCTKQKAEWIDELLRAIASYPQDVDTYLSEWDTINVGESIDRNSSCYTGILLASPDPTTLGLIKSTSDQILVHQVVGLLPVEVHFAEEHGGGKKLWQKLDHNEEQLLDVKRLAVV